MSDAKPEHRDKKTRSGPSSGSFKVARVEVQELAALSGPGFDAPSADLLSDELLVERTLRGEGTHYDVLMRRSAARVYRIARGIVGDSTRAEDVLQAALVQAYESLPSFDRMLRFGDWLSRIAIHGALAALRRAPSAKAKERRRQLELVRQLEDAVDALPEEFRVAFTLCVLDGMPLADVSQALGVPEAQLELRAFRGRLRVRRELAMRFDDAESRAYGLDLASADAVLRRVRARLGLEASRG
jgi:RNA polymerase sigma-70 factor (ECF subfamily)